jgi:hypothetical protein
MRGSPIVDGAGERFFDDSMRNGGIGSRFLMIVDGRADVPVKEAAEKIARSFNDMVELRWSKRRGVALVRPDGYAAFSAPHGGIEALKHAGALVEKQTALTAAAA